MREFVSDTHALFWYLADRPRLGAAALAVFIDAENGLARVYIPSIVLAELYYLNEKVGRPLDFAAEYANFAAAAQFTFVDFRADDTLRFDTLASIPEMHDRIIAGAAASLGCPCLTRDATIAGSGAVAVVW